jgi:hypothetical protein
MVIIAAWFHDTGYIKGSENHENESVCIVSDFLRKKINQMNTYKKLLVLYEQLRSIMCRKRLKKIIRDADYFHFCRDNYSIKCNLLKKNGKVQIKRSLLI